MKQKLELAEKLRPKTPKGYPGGVNLKLSLLQKLSNRSTLRVANQLTSEPDCDLKHENNDKVINQTISMKYN